jgi:hypothetical protein
MIDSRSATGLSLNNYPKTTSVNQSLDYIQRLKQLLGMEQTSNELQECGDHNIIVRAPRWPIRSILLVVRGSQDDRSAIEFAFCLARKCHASLVTLAVVPDVPAFYRNFTNIQIGLPTLFELNTEPGCQLREILRRMASENIKGDIQACQTTPDHPAQASCRCNQSRPHRDLKRALQPSVALFIRRDHPAHAALDRPACLGRLTDPRKRVRGGASPTLLFYGPEHTLRILCQSYWKNWSNVTMTIS